MAVAHRLDFEIDFAKNAISGSAAWFFVIIVKFIFTAIFEIKNYVEEFLGTKNSSNLLIKHSSTRDFYFYLTFIQDLTLNRKLITTLIEF